LNQVWFQILFAHFATNYNVFFQGIGKSKGTKPYGQEKKKKLGNNIGREIIKEHRKKQVMEPSFKNICVLLKSHNVATLVNIPRQISP
jgi:hypothetical protein